MCVDKRPTCPLINIQTLEFNTVRQHLQSKSKSLEIIGALEKRTSGSFREM